jgi:carboxylesterase
MTRPAGELRFAGLVTHVVILRWFLRVGAALVVLVLLTVGAIYAWPLGLDGGAAKPESSTEAQVRIAQAVARDEADPAVTPDCRTQALVHPGRRAKAVLMLHGYTECPAQFSSLAQRYHDQGYNVYVPRAPRHGVTDPKAHTGLHADELLAYASESPARPGYRSGPADGATTRPPVAAGRTAAGGDRCSQP